LATEIRVATWDVALATAKSKDSSNRHQVIVSWGRDPPASAASTAANRIASQPVFFRGRELVAIRYAATSESRRD
jgi:hypothetical protein